MIGQERLVAKLKSYSIKTLPHSILLIGENGCGKHLLISELEKHYNITAIDITDALTLETIQEIEISTAKHFYIIDMTKVTEKQQNVILKFLEEPVNNAYIVLTTTSKSILLDTVINRCVSFEFSPYTSSQLLQFVPFEENIEILADYCHTPGQIKEMNVEKINYLITLCDNIITNVGKAKFPDILRISSRVKQDKDDAVNLDIFYNVLAERLFRRFTETSDINYRDMFIAVSESLKKHNNPRFNQELLIDSLAIDLHNILRGATK